jgi:two-component system, NtrC family, sensor kinase
MKRPTRAPRKATTKATKPSPPRERAARKRPQAKLREAPEVRVAATELLRLLRHSPADGARILEGIARTAMRLCKGAFSVISRYDGDRVHVAAHAHVSAEGVEALQQLFPLRPGPATLLGRVALEGRAVHIPDAQADPEFNPALARALGSRSMLAAPLVRDGRVVGAIAVGRLEHRPFTDAEITRLQTFAEEAVIAIDYVRVSTELETRNRELS